MALPAPSHSSADPPGATKADEIAAQIEELIVTGQLAPGTVLRQDQLAERFAVSRTPIREALRRLAGLGLLSLTPNRGARVLALSTTELSEAFAIRAELEGLAAERAAERITQTQLAELDQACQTFAHLTHVLRDSTTSDTQRHQLEQDWVRANEQFHDTILNAADAPQLQRMAQSVRRTFYGQVIWANTPNIGQHYKQNVEQHRAIHQALIARSATGARSLLIDHILHSARLLENILNQITANETSR